MNSFYNDFTYPTKNNIVTTSNDAFIWIVLSVVIAIVGGIAIYFAFLNKNNENKLTGFWKDIYDFLNFKKIYLTELLKLIYVIVTIGMNLLLLTNIFSNFFITILSIIFGNIALRITYELVFMFINLYENVSEINNKMNNKDHFKKKFDNNIKELKKEDKKDL